MRSYRGLSVPRTLIEREVYPTLDAMYEEVYDRRATLKAHQAEQLRAHNELVKGKRGVTKPRLHIAPAVVEHEERVDQTLLRILGGIPRARKVAA